VCGARGNDVAGGLVYWTLGYALSFGPMQRLQLGTRYLAFDPLAEHPTSWQASGEAYAHYALHFSFASTATTIVSGAVAERMKFNAYMVLAAAKTLFYALTAGWIWHPHG